MDWGAVVGGMVTEEGLSPATVAGVVNRERVKGKVLGSECTGVIGKGWTQTSIRLARDWHRRTTSSFVRILCASLLFWSGSGQNSDLQAFPSMHQSRVETLSEGR